MTIIERIKKFMTGRYGVDQLEKFLFVLTFITWGLCIFTRIFHLYKLNLVFSSLNFLIYIYAIFRFLSKNIYSRTLENEKYLRIRSKVMPVIKEKTKNLSDKNYIYKICPRCDAKLRLKRVKGKHITQCPKCGKKFKVRVYVEYNEAYDDQIIK